MNILLKYLFRNLKEKKLRSFMIFFSVALTSALFFTSLAITDTISDINLEMHRSMVGNADIRILPKESKEASPYVKLSDMNIISNETENAVGMLNGNALYAPSEEEMIYINVIGTSTDDLAVHNPVNLIESNTEDAFEGNRIIISRITAEKYNLTLGSTMELEFGNHKEQFTVYGIAGLQGVFMMEGTRTTILMPKATLAEIYGLEDEVSDIYIKLKNVDQTEEVIQRLTPIYSNSEVTEALNASDLQQSMTEIQLPLKLVTIFIILMCVFIVYTSFKIISLERLPNIGTFRSVGATKKMAGRILKLESLLFGIGGGIAGMGLGVAALYLITNVMVNDITSNTKMIPEFSPVYLLFTFLFAVIISFLSAMVPIRGIFKIPTKNLILNQGHGEKKHHRIIPVIGIIILAASIIIPKFIPQNPLLVLIVDDTCIATILVALVMLLPTIIRCVVPILEKIFSLGGQDGVLAAKNLRDNKSILNIVGLLIIGISTLIMISSINRSMVDELFNTFSKTIKFDISLSYQKADQAFLEELRTTDGITDVTRCIVKYGMKVTGREAYLRCMYGMDSERFLNHWNYDIPKEMLRELDKGRYIILGSTVLEGLKLKVGDDISLDFEDGAHSYRIIDSFETFMYSGSIAVISDNNMMVNGGYSYYTEVYIKTSRSAEEVQKELQAKYLKDLTYNRTKAEMLLANTEGIERVFSILRSYSQLTMLIGIIGIINNLSVSFMERKRSFAVYRSIGMSSRQLKKMLLLEAMSGGIIGGTIGLLAAALMLGIMPDVMKQIMGPMDMTYSLPLFAGYFTVAVIIMVLASLIPAFKSSKLSIIETIKYE